MPVCHLSLSRLFMRLLNEQDFEEYMRAQAILKDVQRRRADASPSEEAMIWDIYIVEASRQYAQAQARLLDNALYQHAKEMACSCEEGAERFKKLL